MQVSFPDVVIECVEQFKDCGPVNLCCIKYIMGIEAIEVRNDAPVIICWLGRSCEGDRVCRSYSSFL